MIRMIGTCGALAISAGAMAAPFAALSYEAGGGLPGIVGPGFATSGGGFFNASGGSIAAMSPANGYTAAAYQEFDSHFGLDTFGPSARNRSVTPGNNSTATTSFYGNYGAPGGTAANYDEGELIGGYSFIAGPGSHIGDDGGDADPGQPDNLARGGVGVAPPPVVSGFAPNASGGRSALDGVFVARLSVRSGAVLSGGMLFNMAGGVGGPTSAILSLGGAPVLMGTSSGAQPIVLVAYRITTVDIDVPSTSGDDQNDPDGLLVQGSTDVYDLWVQVVPTPGALALVGLGGLATLRRRRA